jgi:exopolyphosphatase/guanosine-5'-triphosphate,3'-diphosphate pyrophosphatase
MILAGIDIGTNATRLLIAEISTAAHRTLYAARATTRLGQDLERIGELSPEAQERTLEVLEEYAGIIGRYAVDDATVVGTSSLRRAANASRFIEQVRKRTGLALSVISGNEEARFTLVGVRRALSQGEKDPLAHALVADIGGGSTELIITRAGTVCSDTSLDLGAVYLTERFLSSDPPAPDEVHAVRTAVRYRLATWEREQARPGGCDVGTITVCAGTAGTITTLAAMTQGLTTYDPDRINGYELPRDAIAGLIDRLASASVDERAQMAGLEPGRADIILAGAIIAHELMMRCGKGSMLVSDWGLREGLVFDRFERLTTG